MKTEADAAQKSFWKMVPAHYWAGILGGLFWVIWLGFVLSVPANELRFNGEGFQTWLFLKMLYMPDDLSNDISARLIRWAQDRANIGGVFLVPFHWAGYIIPFFLFTVIGNFVGKFLNVPQSQGRWRKLAILLVAAIVLCSCWIFGLTYAYAVLAD